MANSDIRCPDCDAQPGFENTAAERAAVDRAGVDRRDFIRTVGVAGAALATGIVPSFASAAPEKAKSTPESIVKVLYESLSPKQKETVCFDWDFTETTKERVGRGLLRTHVSNNWNITNPFLNTDFFTSDQRKMVRDIFEGMIQPEWHKKIDKQLQDDAGGFGKSQSIAIFGKPGGSGKFEFVMTGRHMTLRCDGNTADHVAFGGPIFYGHAASSFNEKAGHPNNVFWEQAVAAGKVYTMLDGKQREVALINDAPDEAEVEFKGKDGKLPGIKVSDLSKDQQAEMQRVLQKLIEPYRQTDRDEVVACLKKQGGLEACHLSFYKEGNLDGDDVWDIWRLEGPAFIWHFRGTPHVHVWVNIADDPSVKLNASG